MKKFLDQFKNLNTRDPGAWPPLPKAMLLVGLLVGIIAMGYFLDWQEQMDSLEAGRQQEEKLKTEYVAKAQQAINLDLYRQQLREIDSSFGALLRQLPNRSQMDALLVDINQAGLGRGLQFELFKPAPAETKRGVLRRAAGHAEAQRQLSRHGSVRERHRAALAHRHAQRHRADWRKKTARSSWT